MLKPDEPQQATADNYETEVQVAEGDGCRTVTMVPTQHAFIHFLLIQGPCINNETIMNTHMQQVHPRN